MNLRLFLTSLLLSVGASLLVGGCGATVSLADRPCPCTDGWTCCSTTNVCVAAGETCGSKVPVDVPLDPDAGRAASDAAPGGPRRLAETFWARCLTAAGNHVYWQQGDGLVTGLDPAGTAAPEITNYRVLGQLDECGLAVDDQSLFFTIYVGSPAQNQLGSLNRLDLFAYGSWSLQNAPGMTLANAVTTPSSVTITANAIVYTERDAGRVVRMGRATAGTVVLATEMFRPAEARVHNGFVYFIEQYDGPGRGGTIRRVSLDAPAPAPVDTVAGGLERPRGLQIVDGTLYFAAGSPVGLGGSNVSDARVYAIDVDKPVYEPRPVLGDTRFGGRTFLVSGGAIYFPRLAVGANTPRVVARASLSVADAPVVDLYTSKSEIVGLAADETRLYWADEVAVWAGTK